MEEIWKPIEGFDNYKVSTLGRVYRIQGYGCKDVNAVLQINSDGEVLNSYRNIREASNYTDIIQNRIKLCIDGKIPQAGGYIWRYKY